MVIYFLRFHSNVTSVHWSALVEGEEACFLCVVHQHNVTVWRVSGVLPKLTFKQIRKINVRPIAQGTGIKKGIKINKIRQTLISMPQPLQCHKY